ncbi:MAG: transcriptional repressor LexA [Clostridia bacterium]|nr:transcriptional repressor LexA [Clostridia bacterium]
MKDISSRQKLILEYIKNEIKKRGYPPTIREIGASVGLKSSSTVHNHLSQLEKKGYIRRDPSKPRAIEVLTQNNGFVKEMIDVPLVGNISAGEPVFAEDKIEDMFQLPYDLIRYDDTFLLSVKGESMVGAGILDGDLILVKKQNWAENGEIIVALIDDEATVKRFYKKEDFVVLKPENPVMKPISVKDVNILGKVVGLLRVY